jgi:hypothetical protein
LSGELAWTIGSDPKTFDPAQVDDGFVAFGGEGFQGVFDGGTDPGGAGDALRLEGEVPVVGGEADGRE